MKRFHVHVSVESVVDSVRFYSSIFAAEPTVLKSDYAKWMLDDPRVNFAISQRGANPGVDHLGIQVEDERELREAFGRLAEADRPTVDQKATTCCYAVSDKRWITDPQGVAWETFLTRGESASYEAGRSAESACCKPAAGESGAKGSGCGCEPVAV